MIDEKLAGIQKNNSFPESSSVYTPYLLFIVGSWGGVRAYSRQKSGFGLILCGTGPGRNSIWSGFGLIFHLN